MNGKNETDLLLRAEVGADAVGCGDAREVGVGVGNDLAVLDVETTDFLK
jgi:hypothetical protein